MTITDIKVFLVAFYAVLLLVKTFDLLPPDRCPDNGVDVSDNVLRGTGVFSAIFWSSKASDVIQCWRFCVQRKPCRSLTFDYVSKKCNLSTDTLTDGIRQTGRRLLYSELDWFSSELEPDCYGRPCGDNQVCVPGLLADGNMNGCSYACLNVSGPVCPLPEWLNGPRTPGSINTLSCNAWEAGGGTATCGKDLRWSAVVKKCRPILNLKCQNDTVCAPINAQCRSERCECEPGMSYNFSDNLCVAAVCVSPKYLVNGEEPVSDAQLSASSVITMNRVIVPAKPDYVQVFKM
ncbi:uncharacterized protein LOC128223802, partial [Mya arenaria]|uniref:uncharacterized protein LOC128223802 n=1 Tax=Mya arenaria TaxID=6604 RepID=UPI0022E8970D